MYRSNPLRTRRMALMYSGFIRRGDLCFDVGAHIGSHVSLLLKLGARVVAVEPHPGCVRILRLLYGRNPNAVILQSALAGSEGQATLHVSRLSPTLSSLNRDWMDAVKSDPGFCSARWEERVEVATTTLDSLMEQYGEPAFCKIDVEGGEYDVLRGLSGSLRSLSFEYISSAAHLAGPCIDRLCALGRYEFNWMPGEGSPFKSPAWLGKDEIKSRLGELEKEGRSGDIFARRI